jgi:hypothetical protein
LFVKLIKNGTRRAFAIRSAGKSGFNSKEEAWGEPRKAA